MIFYKPITSEEELALYFDKSRLNSEYPKAGYVALEADKQIGACLVQLEGYTCTVSAVHAENNDPLVIEGLLRSALHFAGNRNAYIARCAEEKIRDVLMLLGFAKKADAYEGDIPTLLAGSCCK